VHTDPFILDFVDIAPELYPLTLNLPSVERIAEIADSLADLLLDPALPPTGFACRRRQAIQRSSPGTRGC